MNRTSTYLVGMTLGLALAGCGDDDSDSTTIALSFEAQNAAALTLDDGTEISRLELQLSEIKFLPESGDETAAKYKGKGEFLLNLLSADDSTVPAEAIEPGTYKKVEFKVQKPKDGTGLDDTDAVVWFEGEKDGIAFRYLDERMDKITLRDQDGLTLSDGDSGEFVVALNVAEWLADIDLSTLEETDGVVVIEEKGANKEAHQRIEDAIRAAIKIARKK